MKYVEKKFGKIVWKKYALHMIKTIPEMEFVTPVTHDESVKFLPAV